MQNKSIAATASSVAEAIETAVSAAFLQVSGNASLPGTNLLSCYLIRQRLLKFCSCRVDTMYCMHAFTIRSHMIFDALYAKVALVRLIWLVLQQQQFSHVTGWVHRASMHVWELVHNSPCVPGKTCRWCGTAFAMQISPDGLDVFLLTGCFPSYCQRICKGCTRPDECHFGNPSRGLPESSFSGIRCSTGPYDHCR